MSTMEPEVMEGGRRMEGNSIWFARQCQQCLVGHDDAPLSEEGSLRGACLRSGARQRRRRLYRL